jgi:heme exporter protein A
MLDLSANSLCCELQDGAGDSRGMNRGVLVAEFQPISSDGKPWLEAQGLTMRRGYRTLFEGLDLALRPGEIIQLFGANGTGKSTLLRTLAGFAAPDAGTVTWHGVSEDIEPASILHYSGHREGLRDALSSRDNLSFAAGLLGGDAAVIPEALARVSATRLIDLPVRALSAGQKRRVALARLLVVRRPFWLLDEPLAALDSEGQALVADLLKEHSSGGGAALVATHHAIDLPSQRLVLGDTGSLAA